MEKMKNLKIFDFIKMFKKLRRNFLWKLIYNKVYCENDWFSFQTLNYGYAYTGSSDGIASDCNNNYPAHDVYGYQLYSIVLSHESLKRGMKVLEVGCGTGYGLAEQAATNPEVGFTGLDFSLNSIKRAESKFANIKNLKFIEGNSTNLPFESESFDLLFNIESSHCYTDLGKFFSEVQRVLKPGGTFLIADFRMPDNYDKLLITAQKYFRLNEEVDITENVLKSMQKVTPMRKKIFDEYFKERPVKKIVAGNMVEHFTGMEGSITFNRFKSGYWKYFICMLKKSDH